MTSDNTTIYENELVSNLKRPFIILATTSYPHDMGLHGKPNINIFYSWNAIVRKLYSDFKSVEGDWVLFYYKESLNSDGQ